jgi:hypothetical protein
MAKFFSELSDDLADFIRRQHIFFVATTCRQGRINLSPKGMDTFRILSPTEVCYLDLTGSGNETAIQLSHDPRITMMFCSFDAKPLILRLYGTGRRFDREDATWDQLDPPLPHLAGERQVIRIAIESLQTSCGFAVPRMKFVETRNRLVEWASSKSDEEMQTYRRQKNARSIDGLTPLS